MGLVQARRSWFSGLASTNQQSPVQTDISSAKRLAVPGPVCGYYPERDEPPKVKAQRRTGAINIRVAAQLAQRLFEQGTQLPEPRAIMELRMTLATQGLTTETLSQSLAISALAIKHGTRLTPHPGQYLTAAVLMNQGLAEMATGEGKSMAAAMAACIAALGGAPVHLMTTNDYLARRDAQKFDSTFKLLGISCTHVTAQMSDQQRQSAYQANVCYGTARSFAFDYLRDLRQRNQARNEDSFFPSALLPGLCFAIIDEADSILLDEALMPLVLAQSTDDSSARGRLWQALDLAGRLTPVQHFTVDHNERRTNLTGAGLSKVAQLAQDYTSDWINSRYRNQLVAEALSAIFAFTRNVDYIVQDDQIILVDVSTGRAAPGRQLPGMLHGLIAVNEGLTPPPPTRSSSGLTYPRFFSRYHHLSGLSGTLVEAQSELKSLYGLGVTRVARNRPDRSVRLASRFFNSQRQRFDAAVLRACALADSGRAVLIGCDSVQESELLANLFKIRHIPVALLNAQSEEDEAQQVSQSGEAGRITVTTQIAGRGTDIRLPAATIKAGGLHVLNLQHNRSERIDRQLNGRAARQGQPGSYEHWLAMTDSAMAASNLPGPIRRCANTLNWLGAHRLTVVITQYFWQIEDRLGRRTRLRADRQSSRDLHFSSMSDQ